MLPEGAKFNSVSATGSEYGAEVNPQSKSPDSGRNVRGKKAVRKGHARNAANPAYTRKPESQARDARVSSAIRTRNQSHPRKNHSPPPTAVANEDWLVRSMPHQPASDMEALVSPRGHHFFLVDVVGADVPQTTHHADVEELDWDGDCPIEGDVGRITVSLAVDEEPVKIACSPLHAHAQLKGDDARGKVADGLDPRCGGNEWVAERKRRLSGRVVRAARGRQWRGGVAALGDGVGDDNVGDRHVEDGVAKNGRNAARVWLHKEDSQMTCAKILKSFIMQDAFKCIQDTFWMTKISSSYSSLRYGKIIVNISNSAVKSAVTAVIASNTRATGRVTGGRRWPPVYFGGRWWTLFDMACQRTLLQSH
ncbi:hypothetical protein K438DRAFT_1944256 [Mycena galopus ATCC 62051]|nr:hypothetical protein K438DRAFT_1944256 [Mycena galopus ATCC 62051]